MRTHTHRHTGHNTRARARARTRGRTRLRARGDDGVEHPLVEGIRSATLSRSCARTRTLTQAQLCVSVFVFVYACAPAGAVCSRRSLGWDGSGAAKDRKGLGRGRSRGAVQPDFSSWRGAGVAGAGPGRAVTAGFKNGWLTSKEMPLPPILDGRENCKKRLNL